MNAQEITNAMSAIKKGTFVKASWKSDKSVNGDTYTKVSNGVVRFVKYGHIKGVVVKGQTNVNENVDLNCEFLYHNGNTNNSLIQMATTIHKAKCTYYLNGHQIEKDQYETVNPPRSVSPMVVFRVKVENLISLGN